MSLNWREIKLIASELPLEGSVIQRVHQIGFHALVFEMHNPHEGFWELYVEVGTPSSRIHRIGGPARQARKQKTVKLQRFIQYIRAHVEGMRITESRQPGNDRLLAWSLSGKGTTRNLIIRFYSGPGANVIICDEHMDILELLFRRPARQEIAGAHFTIPVEATDDDGRFPVRAYPQELSFNRFIEQCYQNELPRCEDDLPSLVRKHREDELSRIEDELRQLRLRQEKNSGYESHRHIADLLGANRHLLERGDEWIEVTDYSDPAGAHMTVALDTKLSATENIESYYRKYRKGKTAWERSVEETKEILAKRREVEERYARMEHLAEHGTVEEKRELLTSLASENARTVTQKDPYRDAPGLRFTSGSFTLLVGRNAKENEELLRKWARGNDWWMHTRDTPGGYVFIKTVPGKSIPLETILDAANLALLYSKAKDSGKADLYYTQVKYLKRPKGGKSGLVIPTQEKNIPAKLDEARIKRLFSTKTEP